MADSSFRRQELATAYLLGHATDAEAREFETLYRSDEGFRGMVSEMEGFLAPLNEEAPVADPPAGLLDDILSDIGDEPAPAPSHPAPESGPMKAANENRPRHPQRPWQFATAASILIAAIATGLHFVPGGTQEAPPPSEELLALMSTDQAPSVVVLLYDGQSNRITGRLTNTDLPEDGVWQLWLLREGIDGPQSLGLLQELSDNGVIDLEIATQLAAGSDTLAISLEPEGGSPEAGPTGPIVYTGKVDPI